MVALKGHARTEVTARSEATTENATVAATLTSATILGGQAQINTTIGFSVATSIDRLSPSSKPRDSEPHSVRAVILFTLVAAMAVPMLTVRSLSMSTERLVTVAMELVGKPVVG